MCPARAEHPALHREPRTNTPPLQRTCVDCLVRRQPLRLKTQHSDMREALRCAPVKEADGGLDVAQDGFQLLSSASQAIKESIS